MTFDNHDLADRLTRSAVILTRWLRAADPAPKLSGAQASALAIIVHSKGIKPSALAQLEEVKRPTVARTISQLEALGLIARKRDQLDGRSVTLVVTPSGRALFDEGQRRRVQPLREALSNLSARELRQMNDSVRTLEQILNRETMG